MIYPAGMKRIVMRPRIQITLLVVIFGVFGLIGVTYFTEGDVIAERDWFGLILGCVLTIGGALGIWRTLRLGVVIDENGVRVRNLDRRDQVTAWRDVRAIDCEPIDSRAGMTIYGPVLRLDGTDGLPVRVLGSYSQRHAETKTAELRGIKEAASV
jgi:hypothetical protein